MALQFELSNPYVASTVIPTAYAKIRRTTTEHEPDANASDMATITVYVWHDYQARQSGAQPVLGETVTVNANTIRALTQPGDNDPRQPMYRYLKTLDRYANAEDV
jgi:hypothetical protein